MWILMDNAVNKTFFFIWYNVVALQPLVVALMVFYIYSHIRCQKYIGAEGVQEKLPFIQESREASC